MNLLEVMNSNYTTQITDQRDESKGHWLLKPDHMHPLYSQTRKMKGSEVIQQIQDMQAMIERLQDAQQRLLNLIGSTESE